MAKKKKDEQRSRMTDAKQSAQQNRQNVRYGTSATYSTGDTSKKSTRQAAVDIARGAKTVGSVAKASTKSSNSSTSTKKSSYASSGVSQRASTSPSSTNKLFEATKRKYSGNGYNPSRYGSSSARGDDRGVKASVTTSLRDKKGINLKSRREIEDYDKRQADKNRENKIDQTVRGSAKQFVGGHIASVGTSLQEAETTARSYNKAKVEKEKPNYSLRSREEAERREQNIQKTIGNKEGVNIRKAERVYDEYDPNGLSQKLIRKGDRLIESGSKDIEKAKEGAGRVGRLAVDLGSNALQMAGDRMMAFVPGVGQALAMGSLMNRAGGTASYEARQSGMNADQQFMYQQGTALIEGLSEEIFNSVSAFQSTYGKGAFSLADKVSTKTAASKIVQDFLKNNPTGQALATNLARLGAQGFEEGIEEVVADIAEPALKYALIRSTDPTAQFEGYNPKDIAYDFMIGALMGGLPGGVEAMRGVSTDVGMSQAMADGKMSVDNLISQGLVQGREGANRTNAEVLANQMRTMQEQGKEIQPIQVRMLQNALGESEISNALAFEKRGRTETERATEEGRLQASTGTAIEESAYERGARAVEEKNMERVNTAMGEDSSEASRDALGRVLSGTADIDDHTTILTDSKARETVEELTGEKLSMNNAKARDQLETLTLANEIANKDTLRKEVQTAHAEDIAKELSSMDRRGGELFKQNYDEAVRVIGSGTEYLDVFQRLYTDGTVKESNFDEAYNRIVLQRGGAVAEFFTEPMARKAFNAGRVAIVAEEGKAIAKSKANKSSETGSGISFEGNAKTKISKRQADLLGKFADRANVHIRVVEHIDTGDGGEANGMYKDGIIYIAADSDNKLITVAKHELTHHIRQTAPERYQELEDFVFQKWYNSDADAMENKVAKYQRWYDCTAEEAREEIIADASEAFFTDEAAIQEALSFSEKLGKAIHDGIHTLLDNFLDIQGEDTLRNKGYGEFLKDIDILRDAEQMWLKALDESANRGKNTDSVTESELEAIEGKNLYSIKEGKARWTDNRIDQLIEEYGASHDDRYSKAYAVMMNPREFLKLTLSDESLGKWNESAKNMPDKLKGKPYRENVKNVHDERLETGVWIHDNENYPIDYEELARQKQTPFLEISSDNGTMVDGHEGRHRMRALMEAGVESVPVVIRDTDTKYTKDHVLSMALSSQDFGRGAVNNGARVILHNLIPIKQSNRDELIERFGGEADVKFSKKDQDYLDAVNRGDMKTAQRMVDEKASSINTIAKDSKGKPIHLYHGTNSFGFTVFKDTQHNVPFIYTSTDRTVSAHYAGDNHYASTRPIGTTYKTGNSTKDIIENAKYVLGADLKVMSKADKKARYDQVREEALKVADKLDELESKYSSFNFYTNGNEKMMNAVAWVENQFWTIRDGDFQYDFDNKSEDNEEWRRSLEEDVERFKDNIGIVREYYNDNYKNLNDGEKALLSYLIGYDLGDVAIDIEYGMLRVATDEDLISNKNGGNIIKPSDLKENMDRIHNIGAYDMYGDLGDNPFEFDAKGSQFWAVEVPKMGEGYFSTDQICKWASENGYTSVIMHNIYDYGDKADNYVFFGSNQLKSADPVTYDDKGDVIPLSERFNEKNDDIRYSRKDSDGNTLSEGQAEYFKDSKVRDSKGNLLVMFHGSMEDFTVFQKDKIREIDYDAPFNGFWFTSEEREADPAFRDARFKKKVYLNITNPAPYEVWRQVNKQIEDEWFNRAEGKGIRETARSLNDELRMRLQDMGYDGVHFDGAYNFTEENVKEYNEKGTTTFTSAMGKKYDLRKSEYDDARLYPHNSWNEIIPYGSAEDFLEENSPESPYRNADVWVAFEPNQIKLTSNENPTANEDIRFSKKEDQAYMDAVNRGDMETAQRMVEQEARKRGYNSPLLFHGTRSFGFTRFDLSHGYDWTPTFATNNKQTAETYSGETNRGKINERSRINIDNLQGEQLLSEAKKHLKQYSDFKVMTESQKANEAEDARNGIKSEIKAFRDFIEDNKYAFDDEKMSITSRMIDALNAITEASENDDIWDSWEKYQDAGWDFKWADESLFDEFLKSVNEHSLAIYKNRIDDLTYDGTLFYNDRLGLEYVFDNQVALELDAELHKGIYSLYGNIDNMLVIDAEGSNWNQIIPPDELNLYGVQKTRDIAEEAKSLGYSGVLFKNLKDNGGETAYNGVSDVYVFFNANALKSADPVTYDDNGNVIPLSERFNAKNEDIRYSRKDADSEYMKAVESNDMATAQRLVDEQAKRNGYNLAMYHGTGEFFNVFNRGSEGIHIGNKEQATQVARYRYNDRSKSTRYTWEDIKKNINTMTDADKERMITTVRRLSSAVTAYNGDISNNKDFINYMDSAIQKVDEGSANPTMFRVSTFDRKVGENLMSLYAKINNPFVINDDVQGWYPNVVADIILLRSHGKTTYRSDYYLDGVYDISGEPITLSNEDEDRLYEVKRGNATTEEGWDTISDVLKNSGGYDGIKYLNKFEGSRKDYSYIALKPSDVKSADPVTYDDNGNVIPLSERFNAKNEDIRYSRKEDQYDILQNANPMLDTYHTGIRSAKDIKNASEVFARKDFSGTPDWTYEDAQKALKNGKITVFSSKPIVNGAFVTPSMMEAESYAGEGNFYQAEVPIEDVAWIDSVEGQYAKVSNEAIQSEPKFSIKLMNHAAAKPVMDEGGKVVGARVFRDKNGDPLLMSGLEVTSETMRLMGKESKIPFVKRFLEKQARFMEKMGEKYTFIGLKDVSNADLEVRRDKNGKPVSIVVSAMVKNGEYPVNFDFSSICKKRQALSKLFEKLSTGENGEFLDSVELSVENLWRINEILSENGFETACLGCFVETKRYGIENWADTFAEKWNKAVLEKNPNAEYFNFASSKDIDFGYVSDEMDRFAENKKDEREKESKRRKKERASFIKKWLKNNPGESEANAEKAYKQWWKKAYNLKADQYKESWFENPALSNEKAIISLVNSGDKMQKLIRKTDLISPKGLKALMALHPDFYGVLYGHFGSGTPKPMVSFTPYNSEIALLGRQVNPNGGMKRYTPEANATLVNKLVEIGGVRIQSFSDFLIQNTFDYMQMVADMAARNFPAHAYTKEIAFAKIFGLTGIKINLSVMFDVDPEGIAPGLDKNGNYVVADKSRQEREKKNGNHVFAFSISYDEAVKLQNSKGYDGNVGIIGVGLSDLHIRKMLNDPDIKMVIPYHSSGMPAVIKQLTKLGADSDYTSTQNTLDISKIERDGVDVTKQYGKDYMLNLYKEKGSWKEAFAQFRKDTEGCTITPVKAFASTGNFPLYTGDPVMSLDATNDPKRTAEYYMGWCIENGHFPLFYQFADEENYYKVLYDFNVYHNDGTYAPQNAVENEYPEDLESVIEQYMKEANDFEQAQMPKWDNVINETKEMLKSNSYKEEKNTAKLSRKSNDEILDRYIADRQKRIDDGEQMSFFGSLNETLPSKPKQKTPAEMFYERAFKTIAEIQERKKWASNDIMDIFNEFPDFDFLSRLDTKSDDTALSDFNYFLTMVKDLRSLTNFEWYFTMYGGKPLQKIRSTGYKRFKDAIDNRAEEIRKGKANGRNIGLAKREYSTQEIRNLFNDLNTNKELKSLGEKVFDCIEDNFRVRYRGVNTMRGYRHSTGGTEGLAFGRTVELNMKMFNSEGYTDQRKAEVLLHESIHIATVYAMQIYENNHTSPLLNDSQRKACESLEMIYGQIKKDPDFKGEYGLKNSHEMIAELSNPIFRAKLKAKNLFDKILDAIRKLLYLSPNSKRHTAFDMTDEALQVLIETADSVAFDKFANLVSAQTNYKYSRKSSDSTSTLSTQNTIAKLEEQVKDLKAEFKRTNLKTANQKDVRIQAGRLIQRHGSNMQTQKSLMDTFNKIFSLYKEKGTDAFDEVYEIARDEAVNIVNNIGVIHNEGAEEYKAIKQYLRETPIQIDDAMKRNITDYNDFRKSNFGRLKLVNGETSNIDNVYMELMELFPEQFTEDYTNPHDQLNHIVDVLDNFAPYYESLDGASEEMQDYVVDIASDIMETAYGLQTKKTFADKKYEEKVKAVAKAREEALASRNRALERQRNRYEKKLDTLKEKHQDFKAETRENAEKKRRIKQISNVYKRLLEKLQTPTDTKHLPDGYEPVVSDVLKMFDFTTLGMEKWAERNGAPSKRYEYMTNLREQLEEMSKQDVPEMEIDPDFIELVKELRADINNNQRLVDLDSSTLEDIATLFRAFEHQINTYNRAVDENNKKRYSDMAHSIFDNLNGMKKSKWKLGIMGRLMTSNFNPSDFFELVGGDIADLYNATRLGFDKYVDRLDNAKTFLQDMVDNKKADKWANHVNTFKTASGEEIKLTDTQLMSLYCLNKREQAQGHIYVGGISSAPLKVKSRVTIKELEKSRVHPSLEDMGKWLNTLTDEQKRVADNIQRYFVDEVSNWGNETSMKLYNYKKFGEENYFPIQSDSDYMASNFDQRGTDPVLKNMGMTKALTKNASNAIVVDDIFTVYSKHIAQMASYNAYVPAITDFQRVWNYTEGNDQDMVKARFEDIYGKKATDYIENFFKNLNGVYKANFDPTILDKGLGLFKKAAVGGNIRVLVQQPTAIARASLIINPAYLTAAMPLATAHPKRTYKEMMDHCPIARWKTWGFYSSDITSASRDLKNIMIGKDALTDKIFMDMYGTADNVTWTVIFKACELQVEAQNKGLEKGSDEYWTKVNELASRVFDRTQVVDSPFHRSEIMKSQNGITKMATAFMAEPTKTINMLNTEITKAAVELKNGHPAKATGIFVRVGAVITANAAALAVAQAMVDAMRHAGGDDDKDKGDYKERFKNYWKADFKDNLNPLGMIPYVKDVWSQWQGYDVLRMDMTGVSKVVQSIHYLQKYYESPETSKYSAQEEWTNLALSTMYAIGVPISNAKRDIEGLYVSIMEGTGHPEVFFHQAKRKYQLNDKTKGSFTDMYYDALQRGDRKTANEIYRFLIQGGITEKYIKQRKRTWDKHQSEE